MEEKDKQPDLLVITPTEPVNYGGYIYRARVGIPLLGIPVVKIELINQDSGVIFETRLVAVNIIDGHIAIL